MVEDLASGLTVLNRWVSNEKRVSIWRVYVAPAGHFTKHDFRDAYSRGFTNRKDALGAAKAIVTNYGLDVGVVHERVALLGTRELATDWTENVIYPKGPQKRGG
jgi:hypothetical protein